MGTFAAVKEAKAIVKKGNEHHVYLQNILKITSIVFDMVRANYYSINKKSLAFLLTFVHVKYRAVRCYIGVKTGIFSLFS